MPPTNTPNDNLDSLLTMEEVMAVVKLGKTAAREALKAPGAPAPVDLATEHTHLDQHTARSHSHEHVSDAHHRHGHD